MKALALLPRESSQAEWIRDNARKLELAASQSVPQTSSRWVNKLGPLAPIALVLVKGKTLFLSIFKLKFLLSLGAFMAFYWTLYGAKFGIGFAALILIHEMGHFVDIKRRGLPAEMPVFLPGLGAYVRWQALGVSGQARAAISLAGPLAGWIASVVCALVWWKTGNSLWAALARAGAWLNVLNLIPVWILDGGQAVLVLDKTERIAILTTCVALSFVLGESIFFLVAAGAAWRLFTKDIPAQPNRAITAYFIGVLASLGLIMWLMPGQGFGNR
jgi:Zn-dependent protease